LLSLAVDVPTKEIIPGVHMPVLSIGTGGLERADAAKIVKTWLGLGGRGIDTASHYKNQATIAKAIKESGLSRSDLFITTKIPGCSNAQSYVESDLKELDTDYIDLLLIHFPQGNCVSAWKVLEDYYKQGKAKAIGVSNFGSNDFQKILSAATVVPHVTQDELNVLNPNKDTVDLAAAHGILVEAYSPVGRAGQSGNISGNPVVKSIAANHNVSTYQVAIKWILQNGHVLTFQSSSEAHQKVDADVFGFSLTDEEMARLNKLATLSSNTLVV